MRAIVKNIPNSITIMNLLSGCVGIILLFNGYPILASYAMFVAAIFDFLDGLIARALKVSSPLGGDLDSLSDVISFGLLPGLIAMNLALSLGLNVYVSFICLIIPALSGVRLAIFNNDKEQSYHFKGLPTPANGMFWACLNLSFYQLLSLSRSAISNIKLVYQQENHAISQSNFGYLSHSGTTEPNFVVHFIQSYPIIIIILAVGLSLFLVSKIPLIAFKIHNFSFKNYRFHFILLACSLVSIFFLGFAAAPIMLILYIIFSFIHFKFNEIQS